MTILEMAAKFGSKDIQQAEKDALRILNRAGLTPLQKVELKRVNKDWARWDGRFVFWDVKQKGCWIEINVTRAVSLDYLRDVILHEYCHYFEWEETPLQNYYSFYKSRNRHPKRFFDFAKKINTVLGYKAVDEFSDTQGMRQKSSQKSA